MNGPGENLDDDLLLQAGRWHAATSRPDCDWQLFTEWLEASPRHREAYDVVALLDERVARLAPALAARVPSQPRRRPWLAAAMAAGVVLFAVLGYRGLSPLVVGNPRTLAAAAHATNSVMLDGGVQVVLAPGSTLAVAGRHDSRLTLTGDAWFEVPHDPRRELVISVGDYQVRDIGTRFEVVSAGKVLKVSVTEGELGVQMPGRDSTVPVRAGQRLLVAGDPAIAETGAVAAADVAGWREGRLVFRNEPLSVVAPQLARHSGLAITLDPLIAQQRVSGVFSIGDGSQLVAQFAQIVALRTEPDGAAVRLVPGSGGAAAR
jgi:transmembrane sensor